MVYSNGLLLRSRALSARTRFEEMAGNSGSIDFGFGM
jgi:hypothetical protein